MLARILTGMALMGRPVEMATESRLTASLHYLPLGFLHAREVAPLLDGLCQVDLVQWNLYFADLIVLRKSIHTQ